MVRRRLCLIVIIVILTFRDDEEEDDIAAFPVVKESAGKLLETGLNTLQKTLLLKKEVEVEQVNEELREKREEFKKRLEACAQRQIEIQKRQQKVIFFSITCSFSSCYSVIFIMKNMLSYA